MTMAHSKGPEESLRVTTQRRDKLFPPYRDFFFLLGQPHLITKPCRDSALVPTSQAIIALGDQLQTLNGDKACLTSGLHQQWLTGFADCFACLGTK